jgi:hypothetical protein
MFNPRISGAFAAAGFVLSFLVGLVTGSHFPLVLIRAVVFAAVFFALSSVAYGAIQMYLPELLAGESGEVPALGAQVDISVGGDEDSGGISLESGGLRDDVNEFLENPGNSGGDALDQGAEAVYTEKDGAGEIEQPPQAALPRDSGFSPAGTDSVDMLPDLDALSEAFSSESIPMGGGAEASGTSSPANPLDNPDVLAGRSRKTGLDEEFNVKEMASAIQTILKRENKG